MQIKVLNYHNRGWRALCKRAGVVGLRWHDLRREVISRMFERGLSITEVQSLSGHLTLQMLSTYTTHEAEKLAIKKAEQAEKEKRRNSHFFHGKINFPQ